MPVVFSDSFNRGSSGDPLGTADSGQTWSTVSGLSTNVVLSGSGTVRFGSGYGYAVVDLGSPDVRMQVTYTLDRAHGGLILRLADSNNFIACSIIPTGGGSADAFAEKREAGTFSDLAARVSFTLGAPHVLWAETIGNNLHYKLDGATIYNGSVPSGFAANTKFGVFGGGSPDTHLDDVTGFETGGACFISVGGQVYQR